MPLLGLLLLAAISPHAHGQQCEVDTQGECKFGLCFNWRRARCETGQKCMCPAGSCATDGECVPAGECPRFTGYACNLLSCASSLNAICTPRPSFPHPCLMHGLQAFGLLVCALMMPCLGSCVCLYKHACHKSTLVLTLLAAAVFLGAAGYMASGLGTKCIAIGVLNHAGVHFPETPELFALPSGTPPPTTLQTLSLMGWKGFSAQMCVCRPGQCVVDGKCVDSATAMFLASGRNGTALTEALAAAPGRAISGHAALCAMMLMAVVVATALRVARMRQTPMTEPLLTAA